MLMLAKTPSDASNTTKLHSPPLCMSITIVPFVLQVYTSMRKEARLSCARPVARLVYSYGSDDHQIIAVAHYTMARLHSSDFENLNAVVSGLALPLLRLGKVDGRVIVVVESLSSAGAETSGDPEVTEDATGVEDGHGESGADDKGTLEDHKGKFVVGEIRVEATPELSDTVDASDEDENSSDEQA
jgi:hypothetical protein